MDVLHPMRSGRKAADLARKFCIREGKLCPARSNFGGAGCTRELCDPAEQLNALSDVSQTGRKTATLHP